ncbi:MAG: lysophospholipid acyltransferase family protein [Longimicrobiales bacterium]|nr:lysophospholipid acyltransferase family protein [Longimicrobiales bacterium]
MLRLVVVFLGIVPATLFYGSRMLWAVARKSPNVPCLCDAMPRRWARFLLRLSGVKVEVENVGVIDPDRAQILVANHGSWYDVLAMLDQIPGSFIFVAKKELFSIPIFGSAVLSCGHIFIDRKDRGQAFESLATARKRLDEESPTIIMFPEGTRSETGEVRPFKKGAFVLGIQAGVDVVPAAITGARGVMRKGSWVIRPGTVRIQFGQPVSVQGYGIKDRNELTERVRGELIRMLDDAASNPI